MNLSQLQQQNGVALLAEAADSLPFCDNETANELCDECSDYGECAFEEETDLKARISSFLSEIK